MTWLDDHHLRRRPFAFGHIGYVGKPRPIVIVQDDRFDATASVTVCAFTSDPTDAPLIRPPIDADDMNGIRESSRLMVDKITTISRSKLGEQIGLSATMT